MYMYKIHMYSIVKGLAIISCASIFLTIQLIISTSYDVVVFNTNISADGIHRYNYVEVTH